MNTIKKKNQEKFAALKKLNLPTDQYAVIGSGPMGIRYLKEIADIDIVVTPALWKVLAATYGITNANGVKKIVFPDGITEAFTEGSFKPRSAGAPTIASSIAKAEIIEGIPFDSLENVLYYKRLERRDKDLKDILLIEKWLETHK